MIKLGVLEDRLVLKTYDIEDFEPIYAILTSPGSGAYWHKESRVWRVKASTWDRLYDQLEDLEVIQVSDEAEAFIEASRSKPDLIHTLDDGFNIRELVVPPLLGRAPFEDFQSDDLYELLTHNRIGLYNEQGTGKSWELISMVHLRYQRGTAKKIIFLTSNSGVYNIKMEFSKFSKIPSEKIVVGGTMNRRPFDDLNTNVVIMNYGSMRLVCEEYRRTRNDTEGPMLKFTKKIKQWFGGDPGTFILDEGHGICNFDAQQTEIAHKIAELCYYIYPATGTPADKEQKWYSLLRILDPKLVKNMTYGEWCAEYFYLGNNHSASAVGAIRPEKKAELQSLVDRHAIRRFAGDVLNLPPHLMRDIYIPMGPLQRRIYQHIVINKMTMIQNNEMGLPSEQVVQSFPYLILALDNPKLLLKHEEKIADSDLVQMIKDYNFRRDHAKFDALFDLLDKHEGEKIIIWNSHPSVAKELAQALKGKCPLVLNGNTAPPAGMGLDEYKAQVVNAFQTSPVTNILILGQQVMNSSVNITKASVQIIWDVNYDYVQFDQMLKRVYRNGQKSTVHTYFLIMDKSLDVARRMILKDKDWVNKMFLTEQYLTGTIAQKLFNLSAEDVA